MSRTLAAVVAHPDDDTFGIAGTVALHADDPDFRFVLVHATSGEAGMISDPVLATRGTLGRVREEEDRRSWIVLGREPDRHEWLRYPDHGLAEVPFEEIVERIAGILGEERPDVVVTFGPDGVTAHPDHIAVGEATAEAFDRLRTAGGDAGFRRLIRVAIPQTLLEAWNELLVAGGREPMDPTQLYQPRGVPDGEIGLMVDTSSVASRVLAALQEHRTQANDIQDMSEEERSMMVSREHGVISWPLWQAGDPVLPDVFHGLD